MPNILSQTFNYNYSYELFRILRSLKRHLLNNFNKKEQDSVEQFYIATGHSNRK